MTKRTGKGRSKKSEAGESESFALSSPLPQPQSEETPSSTETPAEESTQLEMSVVEEASSENAEVAAKAVSADEAKEKTAEETSKASEEETPQEEAGQEEPPETVLSAGAMLREAREAMGLAVDSAAVSLKLASRQIIALENDEYEKLPARTFVRGFVRNYARLLHIDPDAVLAALPPEAHAESSPAAISVGRPTSAMPTLPVDSDFPRAQRKVWRWLIVLFILALFFLVLLFKPKIETWLEDLQKTAGSETVQEEMLIAPSVDPAEESLPPSAVILLGEETTASAEAPSDTSEPEAAATATEETSEETEQTQPAPTIVVPEASEPPATLESPLAPITGGNTQPLPGDVELEMVFDDQSWVEVRDVNQKTMFYGLAQSGEHKKLYGKAPLSLVLGKGEAVRMKLRGQEVKLDAETQRGVTRLTLE